MVRKIQTTSRRRRPRAGLGEPTRRREIVAAAAGLFRAKGFRATTMEDIGGAVGLLRGSLYYHIDGKEKLLYEIVEAGTHGLVSGLHEVARSPRPPAERVREAILNHLRVLAERADYAAVFLNEIPNLRDPHLRRALLRLVKHYERLFVQLIEEGVAAGDFRNGGDARAIAYAILGMGNWALRWYRPDGRLSIERIAAEFADLVLEGLRRRGRDGREAKSR